MLARAIRLLLPALLPSWRFFDWIAPSPRIEVALTHRDDLAQADWQPLDKRPSRLSAARTLGSLLYNARCNDTLYLVSCAERIAQSGDTHAIEQIFLRVQHDLPPQTDGGFVSFRLVFVQRSGNELLRTVIYESAPRRVTPGPTP